MNSRILFLFLSALLCFPLFTSGAVADSLRLEIQNGKTFVLHQVEARETLYALSRRYQVPIDAIKEANGLEGLTLSVGSIVKVPWTKQIYHSIKPGETLYTLARLYEVSVDDLKAWNGLTNDHLEVNHKLRIGPAVQAAAGTTITSPTGITPSVHQVRVGETLYSISKMYGVSLLDLQQWNQLSDYNVNIGDRLVLRSGSPASSVPSVMEEREEQVDSDDLVQESEIISEPAPPVEEPVIQPTTQNPPKMVATVKEHGIAAVINGDNDTRKYLALHRTAPAGTIMQVRNEMTKLSVFVRVVGKLPDTGANNNILLRLSRPAQEALGALDDRFRVEVTYVPAQ